MMGTKFPDGYSDYLAFHAEYPVPGAVYVHEFILKYFPSDQTISLFDKNVNRLFLGRTLCPNITTEDLFIGTTVDIFGRKITIVDYANKITEEFVGRSKQHTITLIKPGAIHVLGEILTEIEKRDFTITRMKMFRFTRKKAMEFYDAKTSEYYIKSLPSKVEHLVSGNCVAMELLGTDALDRWNKEVGPQDPAEAKRTAPNSLRAIYGVSRAINAVYSATSYQHAINDSKLLFSKTIGNKFSDLKLENSTCCVIKPHAIAEGKLGYIIEAINNSIFQINAMQMFVLNEANAAEFLEVYQGVLGNFFELVDSFLHGSCVAMEIVTDDPKVNVYLEFRKFVGPLDAFIARQIRPETLRGLFGVNKFHNAVHCTDLPEDTVLELEYFFKLLD